MAEATITPPAADLAPKSAWSVPKVPWNAWNALLVFLVPWVVLPFALIFLLQLLAPAWPGAASYLNALANNSSTASFGVVVVDALGSATLIGYYLRKHQVGLATLGVRRFNLGKAILYLVGIFVIFSFLVAGAYALVQILDPHFNAMQAQTNQFNGSFSLINLLALVVIPPFVEETTFRGFMFPAFAKRWGGVIGAILTSLLFGFAHLQANISVYTFILSLLLCALYVRTRSIIPGIAVHMINNYVAYMGQLHK